MSAALRLSWHGDHPSDQRWGTRDVHRCVHSYIISGSLSGQNMLKTDRNMFVILSHKPMKVTLWIRESLEVWCRQNYYLLCLCLAVSWCFIILWLLVLCFYLMLLCASVGVRDVQSVISDYFGDQDPRVRTAALKAMVGHCQALLLPQKHTRNHSCVCRDKAQTQLAITNPVWNSVYYVFNIIVWLSSFVVLLFVFQLQLHERGMKIHQIIYDQAITKSWLCCARL